MWRDFNITKLDLGVLTNLSRCSFWRSKGVRFPSATLLKGKQRIRLAAHSSLPLGKSLTHLVQVDSFFMLPNYVSRSWGRWGKGGNLGPSLGGRSPYLPSRSDPLTHSRQKCDSGFLRRRP